MSREPKPEEIRRAEALANRNQVLSQLLQMDREFMKAVDEGYKQCESGQTIGLDELKRRYAV